MTVAELIKELQNYPDDLEVILQRDPEGNGYAPLCGAEDGEKDDDYETCWSKQSVTEELERGFRDTPYIANCVVLWPQF